jgi:hypothetical protein
LAAHQSERNPHEKPGLQWGLNKQGKRPKSGYGNGNFSTQKDFHTVTCFQLKEIIFFVYEFLSAVSAHAPQEVTASRASPTVRRVLESMSSQAYQHDKRRFFK